MILFTYLFLLYLYDFNVLGCFVTVIRVLMTDKVVNKLLNVLN